MTLDWTFLGTLFVVVLATIMTGVPPMRRAAIVLFMTWLIETGFVILTGIYDPWVFYILADSAAAWLILHPPAGKTQGVIGGLLLTQVMCHGIYGWSAHYNPDTVNVSAYLNLLDIIGYMQLILLGGWAGGHWVAHLYSNLRRRQRRLVVAEGHGGFA